MHYNVIRKKNTIEGKQLLTTYSPQYMNERKDVELKFVEECGNRND